jgi:hypothetical protein
MNLFTPRWFDINPKALSHPIQTKVKYDLLNKSGTYFTIVAGRRSFKTERFLKRFMVIYGFQHDNKIIILGAPTRLQAKKIFWDDLKGLIRQIFIKDISETELTIKLFNGTTITVIGLKEFQRVEGTRADVVGITEFQQCDPKSFTQSLQPMIIDSKGFGLFEGRPFGKNHLFDFYMNGVNKDPGWTSYHWTAEDILDEIQISQAKHDLSDLDYNREYKADFDTFGGSPYYGYSVINNKKLPHVNPEQPIIITCDFNATEKPMSWTIGQETVEQTEVVTYWIKSLSHQFTNTLVMCNVLIKYLDKLFPGFRSYDRKLTLYFYGDYSGDSKTSNSSLTDWDIIKRMFVNICNFKLFIKPTRSIRLSVGSTNARFCNALNQRRQFVDPENCKPLIEDLTKTRWKENGFELDDKNPLLTHNCRSVDYYNDYRFPVEGEGTSEIRGVNA